MNRNLIPLILFLILPLTAFAQKNRGKSASPKGKPAKEKAEKASVEKLFRDYRFNDAISLLQDELSAARKDGKQTARIESDLERADLAAGLMRATERVQFIDSLVVPREQMLSAIKLSAESGRIAPLTSFIELSSSEARKYGPAAFLSELGDKMYLTRLDEKTQAHRLCVSYGSGDEWEKPRLIEGLGNSGDDCNYPFVRADGVTLYFAAQGKQSIGGYDLFVTRYNAESKEFYKAENLGMPYNSPDNDYLLAFDEVRNIGYLVTDRRQPADRVCIYAFIPNESREVYTVTEENLSEIRPLAALMSIKQSQTDAKAVADARRRLSHPVQNVSDGSTEAVTRFVINDRIVYRSLSDFQSEAARRIAENLIEVKNHVEKGRKTLEKLRADYALGKHDSQTTEQIKQLEAELPVLEKQAAQLEKNMRKAELQARN